MSKIPVIAIFDVGKTNKKLLLFDEQYHLLHEESVQLKETQDEDGFPCEDVQALTNWVSHTVENILLDTRFEIKAINFSGYGASFVLLDDNSEVICPLYNYLKPFPANLKEKFYSQYGGEDLVARQTASPVLGNLNSGMQLYRLKKEKPAVFSTIKYALHLPQYLSFVLTHKLCSDITSIGCHTGLWDFEQNRYHDWVRNEQLDMILPPIQNGDSIAANLNKNIPVGIGLHDSSAALIPYLISFTDPFILLSTGTWCITLNPFNDAPLTDQELQKDCLSFLSYTGTPVKASRLFAGYEHEQQVKKIATHFNQPEDHYKTISFNPGLIQTVDIDPWVHVSEAIPGQSVFSSRNLQSFADFESAYHQLVADIIEQQWLSTTIVLKGTPVKRIFVDGGFSNNPVYMQLLADVFPGIEVYAAVVPQASALGAALSIHSHWNGNNIPGNIINLRYYSTQQKTVQH